jgi:hypothetical protein
MDKAISIYQHSNNFELQIIYLYVRKHFDVPIMVNIHKV